MRWAYVLAPPADALVHGLKYEGWGELAREMGQAVARVANEAEVDVLVPVPTTAQRQRHRGYNQAERLARAVAECLDRPLVDALERGRAGATQVALSPSRRAANVMGAFRGRSGAGKQVRGRSVGLVDDVLTTGATASAAARTLSALGSGPVTLLTFARALPFRTSRAA